MEKSRTMKIILIAFLSCAVFLSCQQEKAQNKETHNEHTHTDKTTVKNNEEKTQFPTINNLPQGIETVFGKEPSKEKGFYKFSFPRNDLKVTLDGVTIEPGLAFTTWFAFLPSKDSSQAMLMGDLVLLETEFPIVLQKLQEHNIDVVAIHNHLLNEKPKIMYMHVGGMGNPVEISQKLKDVLSVTATPIKSEAKKEEAQKVDWGRTEEILGYKGKQDGNLLKFGIPRKEKVVELGMELPETYGINTVINFQKLGDKAALTGDFVLSADEVGKVVEILTKNNIVVTALHNHMLFEEPRLFFMHFWAVDNSEKLAKALNEVLTNTNHEPPK